MATISTVKDVGEYTFDKDNLPVVKDSVLIDNIMHVKIKDNCTDIDKRYTNSDSTLTPTTSTLDISSYDYTNMSRNYLLMIKNNSIYYAHKSNLTKHLKLSSITYGDMSILEIAKKTITYKYCEACLIASYVIGNKLWIVIELIDKCHHKYLLLMNTTLNNTSKSIDLSFEGGFNAKSIINIYRKALDCGFSNCDAINIRIKSVDVNSKNNRMAILLASKRKGIIGTIKYFGTLSTYGSAMNMFSLNKKLYVVQYSPRSITFISDRTVIVMCNAWTNSKSLNKDGFINYRISF
jgi:hypothetical protein